MESIMFQAASITTKQLIQQLGLKQLTKLKELDTERQEIRSTLPTWRRRFDSGLGNTEIYWRSIDE